MFPARAGMSREADSVAEATRHVPRASGDEPKGYKLPSLLEECSPRERG